MAMRPRLTGLMAVMLILLAASLISVAQDVPAVPRDYWPTDDWRMADPTAHGLDVPLLEAAETQRQADLPLLHSLLIVRDGYLVWERYYNDYAADKRNNVYSVTKSFTSALVGIALKNGDIDSLDVTFASYFPDMIPADDTSGKSAISLRNLLMMRSGLGWQMGYDTVRHVVTPDADELGHIINLPQLYPPGEHWSYSTGDSYLISAMLTRATGLGLLEYAEAYLFPPLGITDVRWTRGPDGYDYGGAELYLRARDMAKFGFLYLNDGRWDGQQIVPADWVAFSTTAQESTWGARGDDTAYAYHWWKVDVGDYIIDAALGYGGQMIAVIRELDTVIVVTNASIMRYAAGEQQRRLQTFIQEAILPAIKE